MSNWTMQSGGDPNEEAPPPIPPAEPPAETPAEEPTDDDEPTS